jgi:hypothetical protein
MGVRYVKQTLQASYALQIASAISVANQVNDEDERLSPKAIAVRACDIAHQLALEIDRREWYWDTRDDAAAWPLFIYPRD